ncbi:MAG: class I SAM-dependent methyltransferase [Solirubrobacteraceae bacterium]
MEHGVHAHEVECAFTAQADAFEDPARNRALTDDARWIFDTLELPGDDLALDVAAGTGHAARLLAPRVRLVIALDTTAAMLARGQAAARAEGVRNLVFMRGDAHTLPFCDESFDVIVSRFAVHHFDRPARVMAEIARCTRPGGRVLLADLIADEDPLVAAEQQRLELLRDPSHLRALTRGELESLLTDAGLGLSDVRTRALERPLQTWLEHARTPAAAAAEIRERLEVELASGVPSGLAPRRGDAGELLFAQSFAAVTATRP